ncbi:MAG: hypothetical protein DDT37_01352 [Firmicutes bacterium]|nr:hypothetical protein [candidate division NPL-UPA2 bacterium]MBT9154538.1 hypothetical protein [candidate division NPL-UPA2 bacterium]MBT9156367.1 hypothetical protein [candidate division NPL-UPA2 bacterium]
MAHITLLVVLARTFAAFVFLFGMVRLIGKQQLSQMTFFDFISGITLGSIAASAAGDLTVGWEAWVVLVFWTGLTILSASLALYSRKVRKILDGEPTILVHRGKILEENLGKVRYTVDDLRAQLRAKNAFSFSDVEYAILETTGELSVLKRPHKEPPTEDNGIETELIVDGEIVSKNLRDLNKDEVWLRTMLKAYGVEFVSEVFYCSLDEQGHLFVDKYDDHLVNVRDPSDYKLDAWVNMDREDRR